MRLNIDIDPREIVKRMSDDDLIILSIKSYRQAEDFKTKTNIASVIISEYCFENETISSKTAARIFENMSYAIIKSIAKKLNHIGGYANFASNIWIEGKYPFVKIKTGDQEYNHEDVYYALDGEKEFKSIATLDIASISNILLAVETKINLPENIKDYGKFIV